MSFDLAYTAYKSHFFETIQKKLSICVDSGAVDTVSFGLRARDGGRNPSSPFPFGCVEILRSFMQSQIHMYVLTAPSWKAPFYMYMSTGVPPPLQTGLPSVS